MALTYIQAIGFGFPAVGCYANGNGSVYENLIWVNGESIPSKETLDTWIAANPNAGEQGVQLTRYQFRKLFTFNERVAIDNAPTNTALAANYRAMLVTIFKDLEVSGVVELTNNPDVTAGVNLLEQLQLIAAGRAAQILANQPPV